MRFALSVTYLVSAFLLVSAQDTSLAEVVDAFDKANIPSTLDLPFQPSVLLEVTLPQASGRAVAIHAGEQVPRNSTVGPPTFAIRGNVGIGERFVIATVDPDAPTPQAPTAAQIRHFLAGNFVPELNIFSETKELRNLTEPVSHWLQPTPPAGSPAHRYVFLLFRQPADFNRQTFVTANTSISNFNISSFAKEVGLGNPIGGSFMLVAPDPSS